MKKFTLVLACLIFIQQFQSSAQEITYSETKLEDNRDINFEILGKMNNKYVVYKNVRWKHLLAFYDKDMHIAKSMRLTFVPDKTFNIDFITYPDYFYVIYQYQKNSVIYCKAVKLSNDGEKLGDPMHLDTTRIGILTDNKIYNTTFSQDKQKIMIYKIQVKNQMLTLVTKLFDKDLKMLDSTRQINPFDDRKEIYGDILLDNDGGFVLSKTTKKNYRENVNSIDIISRKPGVVDASVIKIPLSDKMIDEVRVKIDNLNKTYIVNSFYYNEDALNVKGLFTAMIDANNVNPIKIAFNVFPDSLRSKINFDGQSRFAFNDFFIRQAIVKKDGGFLLTAEDYSLQSLVGTNNNWNRWNYINNPYVNSYDYYLSNPYWYYRPVNSFNNAPSMRYYYNDILVLSLDADLKMEWCNVISKKQSDDETDNFLSFSSLNAGAEVHFIYIERERNKQVISNQSVYPNGQVKRYPTLRSREIGYEFMPRLARQVGVREVIIPCIYRSTIAFAKVVFSE
ncbi:MAG: hypothetical protein ABIO04_09150 [Ferruginibacter sp.]